MARVNIEERAFANLCLLATKLGWPIAQVTGCMVWIWRESQQREILSATGDQICKWGQVREDKDFFMECLIDSEFLIPSEFENEYMIKGNADQVAYISDQRSKAKRGGEATKEAWRIKKITKLEKDAKRQANGQAIGIAHGPLNERPTGIAPARLDSMQCNSSQSNAKQFNAIQKEECPELENPSSEPAPVSQSILSDTFESEGSAGERDQKVMVVFDEDQDLAGHRARKKKNSSVLMGAIPFFSEFEEMLREVKHDTQELWILTYAKDGVVDIHHEFRKAIIWINDNPKKKPKKYSRFLSEWLGRAHEWNRKGIKTNYPSKADQMQAHWDRQRREVEEGIL